MINVIIIIILINMINVIIIIILINVPTSSCTKFLHVSVRITERPLWQTAEYEDITWLQRGRFHWLSIRIRSTN